MQKTKVLVTGATGFLGQHIMKRFRERGYENFQAIDAPSSCYFNLTEKLDAEELLDNTKPDIVINAAAVVGGIGANQKRPADFLYENTMIGLNLLDASFRRGVQKFVQIGTVCSYPKFCPVPFREENIWNGYPEETNAPYGTSKRLMMVACDAYKKQYGFNAINIIPTNLYGPGDNFDPNTSHVIPAIILKVRDALKNGDKTVKLWGCGIASRDFLYVEDAVSGILNAMNYYNFSEPVNLGTGLEWQIEDIAYLIGDLMGFTGTFIFDTTKPDGQPRRCVSAAKAEELLHWTASTSLQEGLRKTIDWFNPPMITAQAIY